MMNLLVGMVLIKEEDLDNEPRQESQMYLKCQMVGNDDVEPTIWTLR